MLNDKIVWYYILYNNCRIEITDYTQAKLKGKGESMWQEKMCKKIRELKSFSLTKDWNGGERTTGSCQEGVKTGVFWGDCGPVTSSIRLS